MWSYEKELRDTCGYKGAQPYWDWPRFGNDPESGPMFNGRPDSMGSNGIYVPHNATITAPLGPNPAGALPPGTGGGCVHSGPFTNLTVNLGPVAIGHPIGDGSGFVFQFYMSHIGAHVV
jgi:tyrosinase